MSMLSSQINELRKVAFSIQGNLGRCLYRRKDADEMRKVSDLLFEAADTIESMRDKLQESYSQVSEQGKHENGGGGEAVYEYEMRILCAEIERQERIIEEQAERIWELEKLVTKVCNEYADAHCCDKAPWDYQLEEVDSRLAELGLEAKR